MAFVSDHTYYQKLSTLFFAVNKSSFEDCRGHRECFFVENFNQRVLTQKLSVEEQLHVKQPKYTTDSLTYYPTLFYASLMSKNPSEISLRDLQSTFLSLLC